MTSTRTGVYGTRRTTPSTSLTRKTTLLPTVRAVTEDNNNQMWIGTGNGISRINLTNGTYAIVNYSVSDGPICNDTKCPRHSEAENGNILIGTPKGYQTIIPKTSFQQTTMPAFYLTGIEPQIRNDPSWHPGTAARLNVHKDLSFTGKAPKFILLCPSLPRSGVETDKIKYAYKIDQRKPCQLIYAENNKINLSMLTAGNHIPLSVKACNSQGIWSPNVKNWK